MVRMCVEKEVAKFACCQYAGRGASTLEQTGILAAPVGLQFEYLLQKKKSLYRI